jgi:hypothetical protein
LDPDSYREGDLPHSDLQSQSLIVKGKIPNTHKTKKPPDV